MIRPQPPRPSGFEWRYQRALARCVPPIDDLLADYASAYCMRACRRRPLPVDEGAGLAWVIDGEVVVDLRFSGAGPVRLTVHDMTLVRPLRRLLRSRHVTITYAPPVASPPDRQ